MRYHIENFNGEYDFRSLRHEGYVMELHIHEYSEILYAVKGEGNVVVENQSIVLKEHELIYIPPNTSHEYFCENCTVVCAVFSNDFIPAFHKEILSSKPLPAPMDFSFLSSLIESLPEQQNPNTVLLCGYLNLICGHILERLHTAPAICAEYALYKNVTLYLEEHCLEDITLSKIAKVFGYNEKYLSSILHQASGVHFRNLLSFYRITKAKQLLQMHGSRKSMINIAMQSGFSSLTTFNRVFKKMTGCTPSAYLKNHKM